MAKDKVTLYLNGDVPLADFVQAVQEFYTLLDRLTDEVVGAGEVQWEVEELRTGSAIVGARGESHEITSVERVVEATGIVSEALSTGSPIPYPERIITAAHRLTSVINGNIKSISLTTPDREITIHERIYIEGEEDMTTIKGETTLYGELIRVGGSSPRGMMRLLEGQTLYFDVDRSIVQELGSKLYTVVGLKGVAEWWAEDLSIKQFSAEEITDYRETPITVAVSRLSDAIRKYYKHIDDIEEYMADLRDR